MTTAVRSRLLPAEVVAATAGVVAAHAEQITARFCPRMFAAHPELLRVFSQGNQASGEQSRAGSLTSRSASAPSGTPSRAATCSRPAARCWATR